MSRQSCPSGILSRGRKEAASGLKMTLRLSSVFTELNSGDTAYTHAQNAVEEKKPGRICLIHMCSSSVGQKLAEEGCYAAESGVSSSYVTEANALIFLLSRPHMWL